MNIVCYFKQCLWVNFRNTYFNSMHYKISNQNVQRQAVHDILTLIYVLILYIHYNVLAMKFRNE